MRKFRLDELSVETELLKETPIKGELNIEALVFRQIERTSYSALVNENLFATNVRTLLSMLPSHKKKEILEEKLPECITVVNRYQYKYWCGVPLGTPENPVNGSPVLVQEEQIDWHKLYEIVLNGFEECGLTWEFDKWNIEVGRVDALTEEKQGTPPPTPVFVDRFSDKKTETAVETMPVPDSGKVAEKKARVRRCAICGNHVNPGTGIFYKKRLVHKESCWAIAKVKWSQEIPQGMGQ